MSTEHPLFQLHAVPPPMFRESFSEPKFDIHSGVDPSQLFSVEDIELPCQDCGKSAKECVCSNLEDDILDTLLAQVSVPNLAALYQKAQAQGLVKPMYHYQSNS